MKPPLFTILLAIASLGFSQEEKLSLNTCLDLALKNSKKIEMTRAEVFYAKAAQKEALSYLLPQLSVEGKYEQKNVERDFSVFSEYGGAFSAQSIGVTAQCLLYDFGKSWNQLRAEKKALAASKMTLERTIQRIEEETKIAYFHTLEAKHAVQVVEDSIKGLLEQLQVTKDLFDHSMTSKSDILFIEIQIGEKKKASLRAKNEHFLASMNLNRLLGNALTVSLDLEDDLPIPEIPTSIEVLKSLALQNRSDLKALNYKLQSLKDKRSATKAEYAPRLYAFGNYSYLRDTFSDQKNWVSGGVGMQFSLYDGGKTSAAGARIDAQTQEFEARRDELENDILEETYFLVAQLGEEEANIEIDKKSLSFAEENLKNVSERYKQGLASVRDLLDSEDQLSQSRMSLTQTFYRTQVTYAKLLSVIGGL
ncbi:MAG: TolC family protein [Simkaniaceae bacterium]|nr:MAG: TolC family protein [Simkaniaceae bacterium]